jgi:hypothetical protein
LSVSSNSDYVIATISGDVITVKNDGNTSHVGEFELTLRGVATATHEKPSDVVIKVTVAYWEWGDETAIGDADWWRGLKNKMQEMTTSEREDWIGKKKLVSLSTAVQNANAATMVCIGAD